MTSTDPFGRAIYDFHSGSQTEPLWQRDGMESLEHPIERFYFTPYTEGSNGSRWLESWLCGPVLDMSDGAGRHALYVQEDRRYRRERYPTETRL